MHKSGRGPVWLWLSLLSFDAPLVALVWQDFLARCYPVPLRPPTRVALVLTVWAIYLADRLLDIRHAPAGTDTVRHNFYRSHRPLAQAALGCILLTDLVVALGWVLPKITSSADPNRGVLGGWVAVDLLFSASGGFVPAVYSFRSAFSGSFL
jgi:hypothetical protein